MDLLPDEQQRQIIVTIREKLGDAAPVERLRPYRFGQVGNPDAVLWPELGELGLIGLGISPDHGGVGLGVVEEALAYREFGRFLISIGVLGATLGAHLAAEGPTELIQDIVSGAKPVGLASARSDLVIGDMISGEVHLIEASSCDHVVLLTPDAIALLPSELFAERESVLCMDSHVGLERATLSEAVPLVRSDSASSNLLHARALLLTAAYAVGLSEASLAMATGYAKMREQFGKPIGSFQAIKHKCADMAIWNEAASCQVAFASVVLSTRREDATYHAVAAKLLATDTALKNAATNIQVHGAFGFTAEGDAHLYLKRAHLVDSLGGGLRHQRAAMIRQPAAL